MDPALLDTDILSELIKLRNQSIQSRALAYTQNVGPLTFSEITRYEVIRGYKQQNAMAQLARFRTFCAHSVILPISDSIMERASDLWAAARTGGHPQNDADLIIAATALEVGRILATGNVKHFSWIPGLRLENWRNSTP